MGILNQVVGRSTSSIITRGITVVINNPPVWDSQPNPTFIEGSPGSTFDMNDISSDPDSDALSYTLNTGAVSLPSGVTWNPSLGTLDYDGVGAVDNTSGHICTADDGQDTTNSNTFNIIIKSATALIGFPRITYQLIGSRTESIQWTDTAWLDRVAVCHQAQFNFAPFDVENGSAVAAINHIKALNPNVRTSTYRDPSSFLQTSSEQTARQAFVQANYETPAIDSPGVSTDAMSWNIPGTEINSGWPNKLDLNPTTYTQKVNPSDTSIPDTAYSWNAEQLYGLVGYDGSIVGTPADYLDDIYWDIWRWVPRFQDLGFDVDWSRDGVGNTYPVNWDGTTDILAQVKAGNMFDMFDHIQTLATVDRGETLHFLGNIGSWFDWWDGAMAHNDVLLESGQPRENGASGRSLADITTGGMVENWSKQAGFEVDGTPRGTLSINFERSFKTISRVNDFMNVHPIMGVKNSWVHIELLTGLWDIARYLSAEITVAGLHIDFMHGPDHKDPAWLDEFFGEDGSLLSIAQRVTAMGWLGQPIGVHPLYNETFSLGVRGGIIDSSGVYAMDFDNGFVLCNPTSNSNQTGISLPYSNLSRIDGGQSASFNDGSAQGTTIDLDSGQGIFLAKP